jgi:hypothetical protein
MAGHSAAKTRVNALTYVPAIHVLLSARKKDVDARHYKPGMTEEISAQIDR